MPLPSTSNVSNPLAFGYQAQISDGITDILLRLAVAPGRELTITTAPLSAQQVNTAQVPEEFRAEFGQSFARSDFSGGAGLDQAHSRQQGTNDFRRFFDSKGIDVFKNADDSGKAYSIELLNETTAVTSRASASAYQEIIAHEDVLYVGQGHNVYYSSDGGDTWTTSDPYAAGSSFNITGMVLEGHILYVALNDGTDSIVRKLDADNIGGGWSNYMNLHSSHLYTGLFNVKNYLIATDSNGKLLELDGTGSPGTIKDLPSGSLWTSVIDGGSVILAAADDGYIYAIKDDTTSGLVLAGQTYIEGEDIVDMTESNGIIFFSTSQTSAGGGKIGRVYRATIATDGVLYTVDDRQLIKEFGDNSTTVDKSPTAFFNTRDQIYFGIVDSGTETDLYSIYLPTLGYARNIYYTGTSGKVSGIAIANGKLFFIVAGIGLIKEAATLVDDGYLILPAADFYTSQAKQWIGGRIYTNDIPAGSNVLAEFSTELDALENPSATSYSTLTKIETSESGNEVPMINVINRWLVAKLTISANSGRTASPEVYSYSYRAFPEPEDIIARIPINVSDRIERPGKRAKNIPGIGKKLFDAVKKLEGKSVTLTLFKPDEIVRGIVENVTLPVQEITKLGSTMVFCTIQVRGQRQASATGEVTSLGALGIGRLGIHQFGV
ncbi:PDK repeat-containing protein [uncultured Mediterranean phage uvMED]|nr:PDK repeat-containing protein [uncultured Mediterranean phage uvMED]